MSRYAIRQSLMRDEGLRLLPYVDTTGHTSIGYGRNLTDCGISQSEALMLLEHDIDVAERNLLNHYPWTRNLDAVRYGVFVQLMFNMGAGTLATFTRMWSAAKVYDWPRASAELLNSRWAQQVGARAQRLAAQLRTGTIV